MFITNKFGRVAIRPITDEDLDDAPRLDNIPGKPIDSFQWQVYVKRGGREQLSAVFKSKDLASAEMTRLTKEGTPAFIRQKRDDRAGQTRCVAGKTLEKQKRSPSRISNLRILRMIEEREAQRRNIPYQTIYEIVHDYCTTHQLDMPVGNTKEEIQQVVNTALTEAGY